MTARVLEWRPLPSRPGRMLAGFATVGFPSGFIVHEIAIFRDETKGACWAKPPSRAMLDNAGNSLKDESGRARYAPIVSFATKESGRQFSDLVIEAMRTAGHIPSAASAASPRDPLPPYAPPAYRRPAPPQRVRAPWSNRGPKTQRSPVPADFDDAVPF